ncbi:MAG: hypothetical protein KF709_11015 [Gemmatimonadaceae bacterium]|nr:hypothetical protein [Gemmatimonadaceae bacterium]
MTQSIPLASDARERFLMEIAAVVPPQRLAEVHLFPPLRQGTIETGVAVIAAMPEGASPAGDEPTEPAAAEEFPEGATISSRHVVYTARYRWTRKGPDRGKWESEVIAEADVPLLTVDTVVQGVKARADEPYESERMSGDAARALIAQAQRRWQTTP